jgi:hypothetical protein
LVGCWMESMILDAGKLKIRIRIHGGPDIIIITWGFFFTVIIRPDDPDIPKKGST